MFNPSNSYTTYEYDYSRTVSTTYSDYLTYTNYKTVHKGTEVSISVSYIQFLHSNFRPNIYSVYSRKRPNLVNNQSELGI